MRACDSLLPAAMLSKIGVRTVDVGNAMLSMHSIRETAGSHDVQYAIDVRLFQSLRRMLHAELSSFVAFRITV